MPLKTTRVDGLENVANGETPFDLCCVRMKGVKRFAQLERRELSTAILNYTKPELSDTPGNTSSNGWADDVGVQC